MIDAVGHVAGSAGRCSTNTVKDIALSILFIVLGLGCLAGGAYAIVEGWPYILIERGFTLVIVGTVLMTAGVVMLALSRVMAELRRVRGQLSSAVMALSVASMATSRDERESGPGVSFPPPDAAGEGGLRAGPAVLGGALAAGGVLAAGAVAVASREAPEAQDAPAANDTTAPGATGDTARDDEPDLFDASHETDTPVVGTAGPFMPPLWPEAETDAARETQAGSGTEPLPVATPDEFEAALAEATGAAEPGPAADKPFWMPETGPASAIDEDFDRLRDRLALGGDSKAKDDPVWDDLAAPTLAGERRDTSESEIGAAADWMTAIRPGQDRWFGASPAAESEPESVTEPGPAVEPPVWPPQTREAAPFVSEDVQISDEVQADEIVASAEAETHELATAEPPLPDLEAVREPEPLPTLALPPEPEPEFPAGPDMPPAPEGFAGLEPDAEPEAAPEFVASPAPAASEEGVVGAYQVGTAHFTIYADGSIQARTPEGDYSFASMDELKTYLASEKNRLEA
jgi:hypothetical protein